MTEAKYNFIELPTAFGKTTLQSIYADAQIQTDPNAKVIITVPNDVLRQVTADKCTLLAENPKDISMKASTGIYVCTHA